MKNTYFIGEFEGYLAIYCEDTDTYALDTEGDPCFSEDTPLEDMFGTDDAQAIADMCDFVEATDEDIAAINSDGIKDWIKAKEF